MNTSIDRRPRVGKEEFVAEYLGKKPLIQTDVVPHWDAYGKWTPDYFAKEWGDHEVYVQMREEVTGEDEQIKLVHKRKRIAEYIAQIKAADPQAGYWNVYPIFDQFPGLEADVDFPAYETVPHNFAHNENDFFLAGPGPCAPLHFDTMENLFAQVYGQKQFRLISSEYDCYPVAANWLDAYSAVDITNPDLDKFPKFRDVVIHDVLLEQGDVLYVPAGWWHTVQSIELSISINRWWGTDEFVVKHIDKLMDPASLGGYNYEITPDMVVSALPS